MLSAAERTKLKAAHEQVLALLGVPATWTQAKAPKATSTVTVGFKTISWNDTELANAYGIGAKLFTIKAGDIPGLEKFDRITVGTERYTIEAVMPVHINGDLVFFKAISKGK